MTENEQEEDVTHLAEIPFYSNSWYDGMHLKAVTVTAEVIDNLFIVALHILVDGDEITIKKPFEIRDVNNLFTNVKTYEEFKEVICSLIND